MDIHNENQRILANKLVRQMSESFNLRGINDDDYVKDLALSRGILRRLRAVKGANDSGGQLFYLQKLDTHIFAEVLFAGLEDAGCFVSRDHDHSHGTIRASFWYPNGDWHALEVKRGKTTDVLIEAEKFSKNMQNIGFAKGLLINTGKHSDESIFIGNECEISIASGNQLIDFLIDSKMATIFGATSTLT